MDSRFYGNPHNGSRDIVLVTADSFANMEPFPTSWDEYALPDSSNVRGGMHGVAHSHENRRETTLETGFGVP